MQLSDFDVTSLANAHVNLPLHRKTTLRMEKKVSRPTSKSEDLVLERKSISIAPGRGEEKVSESVRNLVVVQELCFVTLFDFRDLVGDQHPNQKIWCWERNQYQLLLSSAIRPTSRSAIAVARESSTPPRPNSTNIPSSCFSMAICPSEYSSR